MTWVILWTAVGCCSCCLGWLLLAMAEVRRLRDRFREFREGYDRMRQESLQRQRQLEELLASPWLRLGEGMRGELAEVGVWRTQGGDWYCVLWQDGRQARARVEELAADSADEALDRAFRKLAAKLATKSSATGQPM